MWQGCNCISLHSILVRPPLHLAPLREALHDTNRTGHLLPLPTPPKVPVPSSVISVTSAAGMTSILVLLVCLGGGSGSRKALSVAAAGAAAGETV